MSRKKELAYNTENNPFSIRLRKIMEERKTTQKQLADAVGKRPQTVSLYMNGQSLPDALTLREIGEYFGVSTDWLLNREGSVKSTDANISIACKCTGLSEDSIRLLSGFQDYPEDWTSTREILEMFILDLVEVNEDDSLLFCLAEYRDTLIVYNAFKKGCYNTGSLVELVNDESLSYGVRLQARYLLALVQAQKSGLANNVSKHGGDNNGLSLSTDEFRISLADVCELKVQKSLNYLLHRIRQLELQDSAKSLPKFRPEFQALLDAHKKAGEKSGEHNEADN